MDICLHTNLQITEKYIGGTERFLLSFAKELNNLGFNAYVVCSSFIKKAMIEGIYVYGVVPLKYHDRAKTYQSISSDFIFNEMFKGKPIEDGLVELSNYTEEQLSGFNADVFHLNSFISAAYLSTPNRNYIVYNHENDKELDSRYGDGFYNQFSELMRQRNSQLHKLRLYAPSGYYSAFYKETLNCDVRKTKLGINLIDFAYAEKDNSAKEKLTGDSNGYVFLLPSRLKMEQKGHDVALKAMTIIRDNGINFKLLITGVKQHELNKVQEFNDYAKSLGIHRHIAISSYADIGIAYQSCDCVISPERYCSYGLSISESMSLGIPTVMSDIPTYKEIGESYEHAHFFECGKHTDMANTIITLVKNQMFNRYRKGAILFRANNDIRDCAKAFSKIYLNLES